jgi:hypothetical protein
MDVQEQYRISDMFVDLKNLDDEVGTKRAK